MTIIIYGKPKGKARPRFTKTGHAYTPSDKELYKALEARGSQYVICKVAKQRQGQQAKFGMEFDTSCMKYTCIAR